MSNNKDFKVKNGIQPTVYHEAVGTVVSGAEGYALSKAVYDSVSFSVSSQDLTPHDVFFKPDGIKMYIVGFEDQDINEYNLSTAWDISTASFSQSFSVAAQESSPKSIFFKEGGLKVYLVGYTGDAVYEYNLSTAWDISTASFSQSFSVASQDTSPLGLIFKPDGSKMYIVGNVNDSVYEYNLSTAWDISTASFLQSFSVNAQDTAPYGLSFKPDGTKMYVIGAVGQDINEYRLSTAWDISTAVFSFTLSVASQDTGPRGLFFKPEGLKMYVIGSATRKVYQYSTALNTAELDLSTGSVFDYTPTSDVQVTLTNPAASGTSSGATLLLEGGAAASYDLANAAYNNVSFDISSQVGYAISVAFDTTGTIMYAGNGANNIIYQYSLSSAFDVSTASYASKSLTESNQPQGIAFKSDGTKLYTSIAGSLVKQWSLSTAWDISTATYDSVSLSAAGGLSIVFKTDGTKLYVIYGSGDTLYSYSLSTAWDLSTASATGNTFVFTSQEGQPKGVAFSSTGANMYMVGQGNDTVYEYSLSTPWDISTASYTSLSFSINSQESNPAALTFNPSGSKMYAVGQTNNTVYQYNTATPATITYDHDLQWSGGTAPTSPAIGETDVITFNTTDGGTTYKSALAIDGAK